MGTDVHVASVSCPEEGEIVELGTNVHVASVSCPKVML